MKKLRSVGPHGHNYKELITCINSFRDEELVFVHNPGNAGDNLINLGTYRLLEEMGVRYVCGSNDEVYPDRVVVYSGGGALVPHYPGAEMFFQRNHAACRAMILLPHTVRAHSALFAEMDERCHVFVRERVSYEFVSSCVNRAHLYLGHDMAFLLDDTYIDQLEWDFADLNRKGLLRSWTAMVIKFWFLARLKNSTLYSLREDSERKYSASHSPSYDMSAMFATADMRLPPCKNTAKALSMVLRAFRHIKTDRLHIAVLSAILGLNAEMHDNDYGKNRDVYNHSMSRWFDNVQFVG